MKRKDNKRTDSRVVIPDNERWLLDPEVQASLKESFAWAEATPPSETDLDELEKRILGGA